VKSTEFEVFAATDGVSALDLARQIRPDLILLDIMLPAGLDGIHLCRQFRADPDLYGTGVVMVTALAEPKTRQAALDAGAADYWIKPVRPRELVDKIRAVLHIDPAPERPPTSLNAHATQAAAPGLDAVIDSIRSTLSELSPGDWREIETLAQARLEAKRRANPAG
jgi:DNA-binding response OmpR family regulator